MEDFDLFSPHIRVTFVKNDASDVETQDIFNCTYMWCKDGTLFVKKIRSTIYRFDWRGLINVTIQPSCDEAGSVFHV